jgi:hypothetical protein
LRAIFIEDDAEPLLLVIFVFSLIFPPVWPGVDTKTIDDGILPVPLVLWTVCHIVPANTSQLIVVPTSTVTRSVGPRVLTHTMLCTFLKITSVPRAIDPNLHANAVTQVSFEFPLVHGVAALETVYAMAMGTAVDPLTTVNITVDVPHSTVSTSSTMVPFTDVFGCVWPTLPTNSMALAALPITVILRTRMEDKASSASCCGWIVMPWSLANVFVEVAANELRRWWVPRLVAGADWRWGDVTLAERRTVLTVGWRLPAADALALGMRIWQRGPKLHVTILVRTNWGWIIKVSIIPKLQITKLYRQRSTSRAVARVQRGVARASCSITLRN